MYIELIKTFFLFVAKPTKAWDKIKNKSTENDNGLNSYAYPILGINSLIVFIVGLVRYSGDLRFQLALKEASMLFIVCFVSIYLASFIIQIIHEKIIGSKIPINKALQYVIYSSTIIFLVYLINDITDRIFFVQIFSLYTMYIAWEGSSQLLQLEENKRATFVLYSGITMILCPIFVGLILKLILPGMNY